jgi:recombinational DNA repair ATPase RecF
MNNEILNIYGLEIENFKRISAIEITPKGDTVILTGQNGA